VAQDRPRRTDPARGAHHRQSPRASPPGARPQRELRRGRPGAPDALTTPAPVDTPWNLDPGILVARGEWGSGPIAVATQTATIGDMPETARSDSTVWIHPGQVLPACELVPDALRVRCATDMLALTGWHLALDERASAQLLPLPEPIARVGRGEHCDLCIDHPTVSRDHAALAVRRTSLILFTLGASGRTFLNGRRVEDRVQLADYDIVLFGDVMVVVRRIGATTTDRSTT
jgi:hypothetical protein